MESVEEGSEYVEQLWPASPSISDEERAFYRAFGVGRGSWWQLLQPKVWLAGIQAFREGYRQTKATADTAQMPGMFLVSGERVAWSHEYSHAGDRPDLAAIPRRA